MRWFYMFPVLSIALSLSATASSLPPCPDDDSTDWHECFGRYVFSDGATYTGEWQDNLFDGVGSHTWPTGAVYSGQWNKGSMQGHGRLAWADGEHYAGEFWNNQYQGQGAFTYPDGDKYVGEFDAGLFHGLGIYTFLGGYEVRGYWQYGKLQPSLTADEQLNQPSRPMRKPLFKSPMAGVRPAPEPLERDDQTAG
jgi:hypothetical protein